MFNVKLLIGSGAGIASAWKFWPESFSVHPLLVVLGALLLVWVLLVATICVLDHRRRHVPLRLHVGPPHRDVVRPYPVKVAVLEEASRRQD